MVTVFHFARPVKPARPFGLGLTAPRPTAEDRIWWAAQNVEAHDEPGRPRHVIQYLPSSNGWYPDWSIVDTRDDTCVSHHATPESAAAELRDLEVPADVWADRWAAYDQLRRTEAGHLPC